MAGPGSGPFSPFPTNGQPYGGQPNGFGMGGMPGMPPGMPMMGGPPMGGFRY